MHGALDKETDGNTKSHERDEFLRSITQGIRPLRLIPDKRARARVPLLDSNIRRVSEGVYLNDEDDCLVMPLLHGVVTMFSLALARAMAHWVDEYRLISMNIDEFVRAPRLNDVK